jgi:MFS family permease
VGQRLGFGDTRVLLLFAGSLALLATFVAIERRSSQPMIDLGLFRNRLLSVNLVSGLLTFVSLGGTIILMPFMLENVLGYSTREVGLLMATVPLGIGVVAPISGALSDRVGTRPITVIGLLCMLFGFYAMSTLDLQTTTLGFILSFLPVGVGMGIFQSPNNSAVMGSVPHQRLGVASGLLSITRTLGQTMGIAVVGALWASRTLFHHGSSVPEGATAAPAGAQVGGLHDTFLVVMGLLAFALGLSVWGLVQERRMRQMAALQSNP